MKIRYILLSITLVAAVTSSCKKQGSVNNNNNNNSSNNDVLQLASVQYDFQGDTQKETFFYNTDGLINKISSEHWSSQDDSTKSHPYYTVDVEWLADKTMSRVVNTMAGSSAPSMLEFIKDSNHQLIRRGFYPITTRFGSESWLGFDNKGRVTADSNYDGGNIPVSDFKLFTWDENDNLVKIEHYIGNNDGSYTANYTIACTYDQHKNPLYSYAPYFFALGVCEYYNYQSKNNLLEQKVTFNGATSIQASYVYDYNKEGYPIKRTTTSNSVETYLVKFTYK